MFVGKQNVWEMDTLAQMQHVAARMMGKRLMYKELLGGRCT